MPPGPRVGGPLQTLLMSVWPTAFVSSCHRRFGDIFSVLSSPMGPLVWLADPADIATVFRGDPAIFHAGEANEFIADITGPESVLVLDEQRHKHRRKLMLPPFHGDSVRRQVALMEQIANDEIERWPVGRTFAARDAMQSITMGVILRTVIGAEDPARLAELRRVLPPLVNLGAITGLRLAFPGLRRYWPWSRYERVRAAANAELYRQIAACRADPNLAERTDVLAMLVRARDEDGTPMSDSELRDQLVTLLVAGHETTATGLAWTFERLVRHPAVLARARQAARDGDDGYLDVLIKESLRARPVIMEVGRRLAEPVEIRGYRLPAGTVLLPSIYLVHNATTYHPDAGGFRPERFLEQNVAASGHWLPFGGGVRRCLGATFAQVEMRVVLKAVLSRVELATTTARPERARGRNVTLVPHRGARIRVLSRAAASVEVTA